MSGRGVHLRRAGAQDRDAPLAASSAPHRSTEGEHEHLYTRIEKANLDLAIGDGPRLAQQLIHPGLGDCPGPRSSTSRPCAAPGGFPSTSTWKLRARLLGTTSTAYAALAGGDFRRRTAHLEAIPDTLCLVDNASDCFHLKLTLARLLAARGDDRRAQALLERWRWGGGFDGGPWFVLATLEHGRGAERLGEREKAIENYRFVTDVWRRPDPELQPYVSEAREALARLARTE